MACWQAQVRAGVTQERVVELPLESMEHHHDANEHTANENTGKQL